MLQWMGGSRRKVATSRKSTQQRQKQYFEQRRRQQQHQGQTTGLETYADGINISGQHHKEHRSLDILSFLNLSTTAQEHKSACPNRREDVEVNASRMKYDITKDPPTMPPKMVAPLNSVEFNQARAESGFREEIASPKMVMPNHNKSFNEINSQPDDCRTDTDQQFSVVDFFGDDGLNDYVEGSPVHEAHVAFSVEGLGKVGMETPVHSPKQPARTFTYDCSSPLNAARQPKSFKNHKNLDDFETEMDAMMQDINMPRCSSGLEFSTNSMDSFGYSKQKLSRHDGHSGKLDSYYGSRRIFDHAENCGKDKWDGRRCFQDESSFNEWEHDLSWKRPSEMNCDSVDNFMHRTYKTPDFTFEGPFSPLRSATDITDKFDILGAPSYSKHQRSEYDHDFMISNGARHHTVGRSFDFGGVTNQPDWSCFVTDERDNLSLLSEESCSSSAVRVNAIDNSLSKSTRNRSKRRHDNAYAGPEYHANVTSTGKTHDKSRHDVHPENIAHGSGKCTKMSNSSKLKPSHYSNSPFDEKFNPNSNWFTEERYMSVNINSVCSSFHQNSDTNCPSAGSKLLFGDPFSASPVPELHLDPRSPSKHSEPVASSPSGSFITEKFEFHDSPKTSKIGVGSTKTELFPYSPGNTPSPDLSAQESVSKVEGRKAESQPSEEFKLEEESCIMNNGLFTENNDEMGALTSKSKNSEFKEAKDAAPGLKASVKSTYFPDHAEKASSSLKTLGKFDSKIDGKEYVVQTFKDPHGYEIPLPCQHRTKEMEDAEPQERKKETKQQGDFVDSSCRVMMLQSYVQFLCVQKVLKEAAAQTGIKKK
ncbi:uncharacterized protein LOC117629548 isoform X2 [Prunus dulcis]|uniref:uncharacterized protein LOC117629548 isoform X2 n=1 Tax=Prunus dulcis TaxID=3755 RepID=UPI00148371BB|nr:uncharacterized protein LOC117629548 isoform X2 [Prunus dulcis]